MRCSRARSRTAGALLVVCLLAAALTGCTGEGEPGPPGDRPNIVFVLTDDMSSDLVRYMPNVRALQRSGTSFSNYTVTDSLCCPSRASIFTGRFPHNTGVFTNVPPDGGFGVFHRRGSENRTFATTLRERGYRTAMIGKYLNGYEPGATVGGERRYVPPGWTDWHVGGNAYREFGYTLNENHRLVRYGHEPRDYLTDVLGRRGQRFITSSAAAHRPFLLEVATFAPHWPHTPAPRDEGEFPRLHAPRTGAWNTLPERAPAWLAGRAPLTKRETRTLDRMYRRQVRSVQAVDAMIGALRDTLRRTGAASNTVFVFSSDNGFHLGQYRLGAGKMTAFDTDVRVPLVVAGPGIPAGRTDPAVVSNIDLRPTFEELGGAVPGPAIDGRSIVPLLQGRRPEDWRGTALIEHHGPQLSPADPDRPARNSGNPPSYEAIRTARFTYVEYADGSREYYDHTTDPAELTNRYARLPAAVKAELHHRLSTLKDCQGRECLGGF